MSRDIVLLLLGGGIGVVSSLLTTLLSALLQARVRRQEWAHAAEVAERKRLQVAVDRFLPTRSRSVTVLRDPRGEFCFPAGALVSLPDGASQAIEALVPGDAVLAYDSTTNSLAPKPVSQNHKNESTDVILINRRLQVTGSHYVFANGRFVPSSAISVGQALLTPSFAAEPVSSVERIPGTFTVFNLDLDDGDGFFVAGLLVGTFAAKASSNDAGSADEDIVEITEDGRIVAPPARSGRPDGV